MASKEKRALTHVEHGFPAFVRPDSEILILGSFPSVKSREQQFFYGHPQNRFWPMISTVFNDDSGEGVKERKEFLARNHIALYDVIESCDILGSSDASIRNIEPANIKGLIEGTRIKRIFLNGKKAGTLFEKHALPTLEKKIPYQIMPSTSPANAGTSLEQLIEAYEKAIKR